MSLIALEAYTISLTTYPSRKIEHWITFARAKLPKIRVCCWQHYQYLMSTSWMFYTLYNVYWHDVHKSAWLPWNLECHCFPMTFMAQANDKITTIATIWKWKFDTTTNFYSTSTFAYRKRAHTYNLKSNTQKRMVSLVSCDWAAAAVWCRMNDGT